MDITKDNVETVLDSGKLYADMASGRFWQCRRNGATKRWARDASRIRIPVKFGLRGMYSISETDFNGVTGVLEGFKHSDDIQANKKA